MVDAGTGTDVMAGGAGAAGSEPDVWHQPPGIRGVRTDILISKTKLKISQDIPKTQNLTKIYQDIPEKIKKNRDIQDIPKKKKILGYPFFPYPGISRCLGYP